MRISDWSSDVCSSDLVDNGIVKPGHLVMQRYSDADIGRDKANVLGDRRSGVGLPCDVTAHVVDLKRGAFNAFELAEWDLVVNATASKGVDHRIEKEVADSELPVALIGVSVSAAAQHGSVSVRMPNYGGGPLQIERQAKLEAFRRDAHQELVEAFWPKRSEEHTSELQSLMPISYDFF